MPCPARFHRATWHATTAVCWRALQLVVVVAACVLGIGRAVAAASIPTVPLSSDAALDVSPDLELYEDRTGALSLSDAQVLAQAGRFGPHPLQQPSHRQRAGVFWGRLRLRPRAADGQPKTAQVLLLFSFPYARWHEVTLYRRDERGHITTLRSGHAVPLSERAFAEPQTGFPMTLSAGQDEELFLRMVKHPHPGGFMSLRNVEITLQSNTGYLQRARDIWLYQGLYLGIIIIMILYNIVIYITERDVSLLWYSGMLASLGVYFLEISGVGFYLPGLARAFTLWDWYGGGGVILVAVVVCFCQFSRHYLSLTRYSRPFDRLLLATAPLTGLGFLLCYATGHLQLGHFVTYCGALASLIGGVGGALHAIFKGYRPAFVYLLSTLIMSIFGSTNMVRMLFAKILYLPLLYSNLFQVGTALQIALLSLGLAYRLRLLRTEREKTERLLRNVLPAAIAERLKAGEHAIAERFDEVSVLFADIVGFTRLASRIGPEQIVARLNTVFSRFDELTDQYGLEKIKTIGDCYMVVSGVPVRREDHLQALLSMALDLLCWMRSEGAHGSDPESEPLRIRIGIHSGPVVAGVIGRQRFAFDLWGDTVNTASRMESHGEPDHIQCTPAVYELMKDRFEFVERGEIDIKGKGRMRTYFLLARRSADAAGQQGAAGIKQ